MIATYKEWKLLAERDSNAKSQRKRTIPQLVVSYPEGHPLLGASDRTFGRPHCLAMDPVKARRTKQMSSEVTLPASGFSCLRSLQALGILCGFPAAEAPTKLVTIGVLPLVISLVMAVGVFSAGWSMLYPHPRHGWRSYWRTTRFDRINEEPRYSTYDSC